MGVKTLAEAAADIKAEQHTGRIPGKIWRAVNRELQLYPLRKSRLLDAKQDIYDQYTAIHWPEPDRLMGPGGEDTKLDKAIYRLNSKDILAQESWVRAIEQTLQQLTPIQRRFFELHYIENRGIVNCAMAMSYSKSSAFRLKREVLYMAAVRLGYLN